MVGLVLGRFVGRTLGISYAILAVGLLLLWLVPLVGTPNEDASKIERGAEPWP